MKLTRYLALLVFFTATAANAQMHRPGDDAFDLIVDSVNADTALELTEAREAIEVLRDELQALRDAEDVDQDAIDALRDELHSARQSLREQVRDIVEGNEELQAELRSLAQAAREDRLAGGYVLRNDEAFEEIVAAASAEQADTLLANQSAIESLRGELQAAKDAGATRDDVSDLVTELRDLNAEQRDLINEVLDANADLLSGVLDDARAARQDARDGIRERGFRRPRPRPND